MPLGEGLEHLWNYPLQVCCFFLFRIGLPETNLLFVKPNQFTNARWSGSVPTQSLVATNAPLMWRGGPHTRIGFFANFKRVCKNAVMHPLLIVFYSPTSCIRLVTQTLTISYHATNPMKTSHAQM